MIVHEVERLSRVVDELLRLGHARPLAKSRIDLRRVVEHALAFLRPRAADREVALSATLPEDPVEVVADREALEQVCVNLLENAVACVDRGGRVEIRVAVDSGGGVELWVEDDGPGVSDALAERVFDPFVTSRPGGIGLGLTFVKRIVTAHRWTIEVVATGRPGGRFRIEIPPSGRGMEGAE